MSEQEVTSDVIKEEQEQAKINSPYIRVPEDGSKIEITVKQVVKTTEAKYYLHGVDYAYEVRTPDDKKLSVNSWALWKEIRALIEKSGSINGATLEISRPKKGKYIVDLVSGFNQPETEKKQETLESKEPEEPAKPEEKPAKPPAKVKK